DHQVDLVRAEYSQTGATVGCFQYLVSYSRQCGTDDASDGIVVVDDEYSRHRRPSNQQSHDKQYVSWNVDHGPYYGMPCGILSHSPVKEVLRINLSYRRFLVT